MVRISVSLILEKNFPGRGLSSILEHEINSLRRIDLSRCSIDEIDNLEVFSDITELCLRNNNIKLIENLIFLPKLEVLDVSSNAIPDLDALCLDDIPGSLRKLIISGNPCCQDPNIVSLVQARCRGLEVLAEYTDPSAASARDDGVSQEQLRKSMAAVYEEDAPKTARGRSPKSDDVKEHTRPGEDGPSTDEGALPVDADYSALDADSILRQLVHRKCEMEGMEQFDIDHTVMMLNAEVEAPRVRKSRVRIDEDGVEAKGGEISPCGVYQAAPIVDAKYLYNPDVIAEWKKSCMTSNAVEAAHDADFMTTLRTRMKKSVAAALDSKN